MSLKVQLRRDRRGNQVIAAALDVGPLSTGANQRAVKWLERMLKLAGFNPGPMDDRFTARTAQALAQFQAARGLPATGVLDKQTFEHLKQVQKRIRAHHGERHAGVGQKSEFIEDAERRLRRLGYDVGKVDGVFDQRTAAAVAAFKADQKNLGRNGELGEAGLRALRREVDAFAHAPYRGRIRRGLKAHRRLDAATERAARERHADGTVGIGPGSSRRVVKNVQAHLEAAGFDPKRTDGVWDERTEAALRAFQRRAGLNPSGRVGPGTWNKLEDSIMLAKSGTSPAQRLGEKSAAVLRTERILKKLGYRVKVDGVFDGATQRASRAFERRIEGTGDDGAIGAHQLRRMRQVLHAKEHPGRGPLLQRGYRGRPVKQLERRLEAMGFEAGKVDGVFDKRTARAVRRFQDTFGLEVDGIVGRQTWRMLGIRGRGRVRRPGDGNVGRVHWGGGWGGSEGMADVAKRIARSMGIPITSTKRSHVPPGSSTGSDHHTSQTNAYAVDFGVYGARGDQLARRLAKAYGLSAPYIGTFRDHYVRVDGRTYRIQLLWRVANHYDHVHIGFRRVA